MPRVKGGYTTRRRRKAVLKLAKGYYGSKHTLYKTAHEQVMRSLAYSYRDRKVKKRDFRKLWISRINAACQLNGMKYSRFINGLAVAGIEVNRKMLAEMAVSDSAAFTVLCEASKKALQNKPASVKENTIFLKPAKKAERAARAQAEIAANTAVITEVIAEPVKEEVKPVKKAAKPVETVVAEKPAVDLNSLTVTELKAMAKEKGISGISAMKKADLIAALQ